MQDTSIFDERSQQSKAKEVNLRARLARADGQLGFFNHQLDELERDKTCMARKILSGDQHIFSPALLDECVRRINEKREIIKVFETEREDTQRAIDALTPTSEQVTARRKLQSEFSLLAGARLKKTRQVEGFLQQLREALQDRMEVAAKMREIAGGLEFEISGDNLDVQRFADCLDSLPENLLTDSERWQEAFMGAAGRK